MTKIQKTVLNRVEGEIELKLIWNNGTISDAFIIAPNFRGFEFILKNKPPLDALVITPRICGICGHAHLIATVNALENIYKNAGYPIQISEKAKLIRKITLSTEIIQNHIRWFYLFVFPDLLRLEPNENLSDYEPIKGKKWRKAVDFSSKIVKIISLFGGQWPHTSYAVPGGVVSDPTSLEIVEAISIVDSVIGFIEEDIIGMDIDKYMSIQSYKEFLSKSNGDLNKFISVVKKHKFDKKGKAYKRFITVCEIEPFISEGITKRKKCQFDINKVKEILDFSYLDNFQSKNKKYSWSSAVRYEGLPYETGPLARRINNQDKIFMEMISLYEGYYIPRIWARVDEIVKLTLSLKKWLLKIDVKEPSYIKPKIDIKDLEASSYGTCEAARGSLIHQIDIKEGKIQTYNIITPTVWNLGTRCKNYLSPAEKAIKGLKSQLHAEMVLRSFDVCSVCTTH